MVRKRKRSFKEQIKAKTENPLIEQRDEMNFPRKNKHDYRSKIDKIESRFQEKIHRKNRVPVNDFSRIKNRRKRNQIKKLQNNFAKENSRKNVIADTKKDLVFNTEDSNRGTESTLNIEQPNDDLIKYPSFQNTMTEDSNEKYNRLYEVERNGIENLHPTKRKSSHNFNHKIGKVKSRFQDKIRKKQLLENVTGSQDKAVTNFSKRKKYRRLAVWSLEKIKSNIEPESSDITPQEHGNPYQMNEMKQSFLENQKDEKDSEHDSGNVKRRNRWITKRKTKRLSQRNVGNQLSLSSKSLDEIKQAVVDKNNTVLINEKSKKKTRKNTLRKKQQQNGSHDKNQLELATTFPSKEITNNDSVIKDKPISQSMRIKTEKAITEKSKEKKAKEKKKNRRKKNKDNFGLATAIQVGSVSSAYLSQGSDDNQAVEAAEKSITTGTRLVQTSKNYADKRMLNPHSDNRRKAYQIHSKRKKESRFHDLKDENTLLKSSEKGSKIKQFQKKKQMKQSISTNYKSNLRERLKKTLLDTIKSSKEFIVRRAKGIVIAAVAILGLGTVLLNFASASVSGVANSTSSVLATSYLSSKNVLSGINQHFSSMENKLYEELENIESNHPGYDEYIVKKNGDIGHNVHELLSYITARYGDVKNLADIEPALQELFNEMYKVDYTVETETRYRTTTDSNGKSVKVPYTYRKLVATLQKKEFDTIVHEVFASHPDNLKHYQSLFSAQGNMADLFGNSNLIGAAGGNISGGIGGGKEYEASDDVQKSIVRAASITPSPGPGWCAMWVTQVYQNAGLGFIGGNANDMYRNFTYTSDRSKLKVGMIVAVESCSSGGEAGRIYGHVGIYIGDGKVMDNIGQIRVTSLDNWIATCCQTSPVGFGFPPNVQ